MVQNNLAATVAGGIGVFNVATNYNQQQYLDEHLESIDFLKNKVATLSSSEATDISSLECKI